MQLATLPPGSCHLACLVNFGSGFGLYRLLAISKYYDDSSKQSRGGVASDAIEHLNS